MKINKTPPYIPFERNVHIKKTNNKCQSTCENCDDNKKSKNKKGE